MSGDERSTVLVIDDSPENRYATRRALERGGFAIVEAETAAEGLALASDDPDVIILDVHLPDMNGFEVARLLKADPGTAHVPVLHVSQTFVDDAARVTGLDAGSDAYLTEPVAPRVLLATVRALLRLRHAEERLRREVSRAELLSRLTAGFSDALTPEQVVAVIVRALHEIGARDATLYLREDARQRLRLPEGEREHVRFVAGDADLRDAIPVVAYGRRLGSLAVRFAADRTLDESQRGLLAAVGERCGQALERAALYAEQRHIAVTLQDALLPNELPPIPGVELGVRYATGTKSMQVGGDFYDVIERPDDWIAVIGDVCGRGAEAAALTSLARHTIRAHVQHLESPGAVLATLNDAILAEHGSDELRFLTAGCARLRPAAGGMRVTSAVGGHPPPIVMRADATAEALDQSGPLLGYLPAVELAERETTLARGEALVFYTDGVIEARRGPDVFGEERLLALAGQLAGEGATAQDTADRIMAAAQEHASSLSDDMAVLVIRLD